MKISKSDQLRSINHLVEGLHEELGKNENVRLNGKKYKAAELAKELEEHAAKLEAVATARALLEKAVEEARRDAPKAAKTVSALKRAVRVMFADDPVRLGSFGLTLHKQPHVRTIEEKKLAAEKAKATRAARHTMGPRQRAKIKGIVPLPEPPHVEPTELAPALPPAVALVVANIWPPDDA